MRAGPVFDVWVCALVSAPGARTHRTIYGGRIRPSCRARAAAANIAAFVADPTKGDTGNVRRSSMAVGISRSFSRKVEMGDPPAAHLGTRTEHRPATTGG